VKLNFNVPETNGYGRLFIVWNGLEVASNFLDQGSHEIVIKSDAVKENNLVEIYAEGPGFMFWASTVYVLRDFTASIDYGPKKLVPFQLLQSEKEALSKGVVAFYALDTSSNLTISVNGYNIFYDVPRGPESVEFDYIDVALKPGNNIISFGTQGIVELRDVYFNLFLMTNEAVKSRRFNITSDQIALFERGYKCILEFDVLEVYRTGNLNIELNNRVTRLSEVENGINRVSFGKGHCQLGENEISFSGTGGFRIDEASFGIGP